jgi:hypothetical protein
MQTVKHYNKIYGRNKIFGLEFIDLFLLLGVYLIIFVVSSNLLINLVLVLSAYAILRLYKKGKAPHWTGSIVRFLFRPARFPAKRETDKESLEQ